MGAVLLTILAAFLAFKRNEPTAYIFVVGHIAGSSLMVAVLILMLAIKVIEEMEGGYGNESYNELFILAVVLGVIAVTFKLLSEHTKYCFYNIYYRLYCE